MNSTESLKELDIQSLVMLIRRLIVRVRKYKRDDQVAQMAYEWLDRNGLKGSILRNNGELENPIVLHKDTT